MNRIAGRAGITVLLALMLIAGMVFFLVEYATEAGEWAVFPGNPHVYNGMNIDCGVVTDRDGQLLLDMTGERTYAADETVRRSVLHWLGDRDGYISAPAVANYAEQIAGFDLVNGVYSYADVGGVAKLTLSAGLQTAAMDALSGYSGTAAVYNYRTGEILCAVSSPNYDPDDAPVITEENEEAYEGIYLNRFVQSCYIPGSIFKTVTTAAALAEIPDIQDRTFYCESVYPIGKDEVTCEHYHGEQTLREALANSCNCAFAQVTELLGKDTLERYVKQFQITKSIRFDGITTAEGSFDLSNAADVEVAWSGIGQYEDLINPCAFMTYMGAIAGGGKAALPYIVAETSVGDTVTYQAKTVKTDAIMDEEIAKILQEYMRNNVESNYGAYNFPNMTVCAKSGTSQLDGDQESNAMFTGFVMDEAYPLAFILVVESGGYGGTTCVPIMAEILEACRIFLDGQ